MPHTNDFSPLVTSIEPSFDVDIIYLWVDGNDPEFVRNKALHSAECELRWANLNNRFADCGELRYSLRSVHQFAPWIRTIYIVTNGQVPVWLNVSNPKVRLVRHDEIFLNDRHLPTFSSLAIECHLHRVPGLSEHFLFANDDMFFGASVLPSNFFDCDGRMKVSFQRRFLLEGERSPLHAPGRNAITLLTSLFGDRRWRAPRHQIRPLTKSLFHILDGEFPDLMASMSSHRFRHHNDVNITYIFSSHYALRKGLAVETSIEGICINLGGVGIGSTNSLSRISRSRPRLFCINDANYGHKGIVEGFLKCYFPDCSPFEIA